MSDGISALCDALRAAGVDHVFGVPGTQNVSLFEGFRRARLRTVLTTHELAASFMANGYFRATGNVAVLATIPGPGFTYALTGLAEARLDSAGILFLVGLPAAGPGRAFQLQAIDQTAIAAPLVKGCFTLSAADDAARVIRAALALARSGEPGPVMVQLDVHALQMATAAGGAGSDALAPPLTIDQHSLTELGAAFAAARRPVVYAGQGTLVSAARLERLATRLQIPVLTTPSARGVIPEDHPLAMGFDPLRGHLDEVNRFLDRSDLVLALGCKLGHNGSAGFALRFAKDRFVHVDADPLVAGATYDARLTLVARVEDVMPVLESRAEVAEWPPDEVRDTRGVLRQPAPEREPVIAGTSAIEPQAFFAALRRSLPRDAIVVTDSGRHQVLTRRHLDVLSPRGLMVPSDLQSMGFGLPAAIGASLGANGRPVVAIVGDGGFLMSGLELLTARREEVPITVFVFNDGHLSQIRMQQWQEYGHAHAVELLNPHYELFASSAGVEYLRFDAAQPDQLEGILGRGRVTLVEVLVKDGASSLVMPAVARAKGVARVVVPSGLRAWLKARLR